MAHADQILEAALKLAPAERADLVEAISASLDGFELSPDWEAEIQRRFDDIDSGRVTPVPGDTVFIRLAQRFSAR